MDYFFPKPVDEHIFARIRGISYPKDLDNSEFPVIPIRKLCYISVLHYDFEGCVKSGELIANSLIAADLAQVFQELYSIKYPIEKIKLVDEYGADDILSMADNNSSAFNHRFIDGTRELSNHAKGFAVDINPLYNPYVRIKEDQEYILPANAVPYADRSAKHPYYIRAGDRCHRIFAEHGFSWGGEWEHAKDYQHFEKVLSE